MSEIEDKVIRGARVTLAQRRPLFNAVVKRPKVVFNKFSANYTAKDSAQLWEEIAAEVNADGSGPPKNAEKWSKVRFFI